MRECSCMRQQTFFMKKFKHEVTDLTKLTTVGNFDFNFRFARLSPLSFHLFDDVHAINNFTENDVFAIQPFGFDRG